MQLISAEFVPAETPEGSNCGLVKNLALSAIISVSVQSSEIIEKLYELRVQHIDDADESLRYNGCRIFVDGKLIGYIEDGSQLIKYTEKPSKKWQNASPYWDLFLLFLKCKCNKKIVHIL